MSASVCRKAGEVHPKEPDRAYMPLVFLPRMGYNKKSLKNQTTPPADSQENGGAVRSGGK